MMMMCKCLLLWIVVLFSLPFEGEAATVPPPSSTSTRHSRHDEAGEAAAWDVIGRFLQKLASPHHRRRRHLQTPPQQQPACGEILDTLGYLELRALLEQLIAQQLVLSVLEQFYVNAVVLPSVEFGVQIRKVCASCSEFAPDVSSTSSSTTAACLPDEYGFDALHSGLLIIPLDDKNENQIKPGTSTVNILCHGTQSGNQDIPSNQWSIVNPSTQVLMGVLVSSMTGTFTLAPDYIGYGESSEDHYRAYLVRRAYPTSVLPLLYKAEEIVAQETNCASALADSMTVMGYSEGGYAAVAVADAMHQMGKTIITVKSGGAPFRLSSVQINFLVNQITQGTFASSRRYYLALVGAAYSQTTSDVLNYGLGQDMLDTNRRQDLLNVVHSAGGQSSINQLVPINNPLLVFNQTLVETLRAALLRGEAEPCVTSAVPGESDLLCLALQANDLVKVVESTPYPVTVCHSVDDMLVAYDNIPNISANPLLDLEQIEGDHSSAGAACYLSIIQYFVDDDNVQNVPVVDKSYSNGCPDGIVSSTNARTNAPTLSPSSDNEIMRTSAPSSSDNDPNSSNNGLPSSGSFSCRAWLKLWSSAMAVLVAFIVI